MLASCSEHFAACPCIVGVVEILNSSGCFRSEGALPYAERSKEHYLDLMKALRLLVWADMYIPSTTTTLLSPCTAQLTCMA